MRETIQKVCVLGSGVMGSGIATHLANAGIPVLLLDIVPPGLSEQEKNNKQAKCLFAATALEKATKQKPAALTHPKNIELIEIGNFDDDLKRIADCDWIIEVVKEDINIKKALFEKIDTLRKPGTLVTSNTSGLSLAAMTEGRSLDFKKHFFITHFFNPVRYMRLLELVVGEQTSQDVVKNFHDFAERRLGKGLVYGKDTPNFVANRIGVFAMMFTMHEMVKQGLSIDAVDSIVGTPLGRPASAAFRTADLVGLDTLLHVASTCFLNKKDKAADIFKAPDFVEKLVGMGKLGDKSGGGFYQKTKEGIQTLDYKTMTYVPQQKLKEDTLKIAKNTDDIKERIKLVTFAQDKVGQLAWPIMAHTLAYSAWRLGEIADDIRNIDLGMQWGFNWQLGPFQSWDALGVTESVERMKKDNIAIPEWVSEMLSLGFKSFYKTEAGVESYYDPRHKKYVEVKKTKREQTYSAIKANAKNIVQDNMGATLVDLGDGCLGLEFHTKMNTLDADVIGMLNQAIEEAEKNFRALVIANDGEHFSAGANLMLVLMAAQNKDWNALHTMVQGMQNALMRMRHSDIPVVAAPFNYTFGGGCEVAMAADAIRAHSELYMGLVELGAGVIPAGTGTKELLFRTMEKIPEDMNVDLLPYTARVFETIATAKVSTSAEEARTLGFLQNTDKIAMNRAHLLFEAKATALGMAEAGYTRPKPRKIKVAGTAGLASLKALIYNMVESGKATAHEGKMATHLAQILCGGQVSYGTVVTEQALLDLEREAFVSLCGEEKSQQRMVSLLTTNKPLRN